MKKTKYLFNVVFKNQDYKYNFIEVQDPKDPEALSKRKIHEEELIKFYKKNLYNIYKIKKGDLISIKNYIENYNPAITGKKDKYHEELTKNIIKKNIDVEKYY